MKNTIAWFFSALVLAACAAPDEPPPLVITTPSVETTAPPDDPVLAALAPVGASSTEWVNPRTLEFPPPDYAEPLTAGKHVARRITVTNYDTGEPFEMAYWLYVPPGYAAADEPWPAILFLHGSGGHEGGNPHNALTWGTPLVALEQPERVPFVIITPHYPEEQLWEKNIENVEMVLDAALSEANIDAERVAITGVSAGGYAAWAQVIASPGRYAAMMSVSGSGYRTITGIPAPLEEFCRVTEVPTRAIHGADDQLAEERIIRALVNRVEDCPDPSTVDYIVWEGEGHLSAAARAYNDPDLYAWFLEMGN